MTYGDDETNNYLLTVEVLGWLRSLTSLYLEKTSDLNYFYDQVVGTMIIDPKYPYKPVTRKLPASIDLLTNLKVLRFLYGDCSLLHLDKGDVGTLKRLDSLTHLEITTSMYVPLTEETKNAISVLRSEMPHLDLKISGS